MTIVERGVICRGERGGRRAVATFPSVAVLPDGSLLAVYRVGPTKDSADSLTQLRRSRDNGRTWSEPWAPFAPGLQVVYITVLPDGLLASALWVDRAAYPEQPLFHPETEGCLPMKVLVARSADAGVSWEPWREVPVPDDVGPPSLTNPVVRLPGGRLIVSIETNKPYLDRSQWRQRVVYCESDDGGETWSAARTVTEDPNAAIFHWDQRAAVAPDGTLAAFSWTYDKPANRYLPIRRHVSRDGGHTWRNDELPFSDQPSHPAVLPDGRAVLAWVDRYGTQSIRARAAAALDAPFAAETEVSIHQAAHAASATGNTAGLLTDMSRWSFGLPFAECLPDGSVMVVYYAGEADRMDVLWARLSL